MRIAVLGAGAWGTALAVSVCERHDTRLWARDLQQARQLAALRVNRPYLDGVQLPAALTIEADLDAALAHAQGGLLIIATPMSGLRDMLQRAAGVSVGASAGRTAGVAAGVLWLCKGLELATGRLGHEVAREVCPQARVGIISGPSFALEVALGQPTALVAASTDAALCEQAVEALHSESLRVYTSTDPIGVEVGGAVKNVLAIATGIADGMAAPGQVTPAAHGLGLNARAALITRGLAEMTRLGVALGARAETFMGLSGLGDLVLTATGDLSRNRRVGMLLAQGLSLKQILAELGHVAEGVYSAATVLQRANALGVEMPITAAVVEVLEGRATPAAAVGRLMGREARAEH